MTLPTKPGFYWHLFPKGYGEPPHSVFERMECIKVESENGVLVGNAWHGGDEPIDHEYFAGEWLGEAVPPSLSGGAASPPAVTDLPGGGVMMQWIDEEGKR